MVKVGDVISYIDLCKEEGVVIQRGMNFRLCGGLSVILMSVQASAPYEDGIEEDGKVLIYEGHDAPRRAKGPSPKEIDQPLRNPSGLLTQNGLFHQSAIRYKECQNNPELVKVYEKIKPGIWVYNGVFKLIDAWQQIGGKRMVFKFKLELANEAPQIEPTQIEHNRIIPASVKIEVWKRDKGCCVICGSSDNLHFDHIIPYSKGGSSLVAENVQLLCARHNLAKRDNIE